MQFLKRKMTIYFLMENTQYGFSLSWPTLPRQRVNYSLSEAAARAAGGVQVCCCCALHCQLTSWAVMTAAGTGQGSAGCTQAALCRIAACIPHQTCLPQWAFNICSFILFLALHEPLEHWLEGNMILNQVLSAWSSHKCSQIQKYTSRKLAVHLIDLLH